MKVYKLCKGEKLNHSIFNLKIKLPDMTKFLCFNSTIVPLNM